MSGVLPLGHRIGGEFVCMTCLKSDDHDRPDGIRQGSAVDQRVGSGETCARCGQRMPYLAVVRLLPDGAHSIHAPDSWRKTEKIILLERREQTLVDGHALVYVSLGCSREVGVTVTPNGAVEVWVHDDPYGDGEEPAGRWRYDPSEAATSDAAGREPS